jgi:hypothetical protein
MNTPFKITIEHIIIIVLLAMLFLKSCEKEKDCVPAKIKTITEEVTLTVRDSAKNTEIKNRVPEKVSVIETPHKIKKVKNVSNLSIQDRKKVKVVNRYVDTTRLDQATIYTDILSEGRILEKSIVADVDHTITTTTITETIIKQPMGLFISPGIDYSPLSGIDGIDTSIMFIKGNWGASFGGYYHFRYRDPLGLKLTLHIKL